MYSNLNGTPQGGGSSTDQAAYELLKLKDNNEEKNEDYLKLNQSGGTGPDSPNKYEDGYLLPSKQSVNMDDYKGRTTDTNQAADPAKNLRTCVSVVEDNGDNSEVGNIKTVSDSNLENGHQSRKLPSVPDEEHYEELYVPERVVKKDSKLPLSRRRLVIVIATVVAAIFVVIVTALIIYYTTRSNTSSSAPSLSGGITTGPPVTSSPTPDPYLNDTIAVISDCNDVSLQNPKHSGVYMLNKKGGNGFNVFCDMKTNGGGWLVFMRREDGSSNFYRDWADYKEGFGSLTNEFWLGNDKLHQLTSMSGSYRLRVDLETFSGVKAYAQYENFRIASETDYYTITFEDSYHGSAGDSLLYHYGKPFTTRDKDNDSETKYNCAKANRGAWWYNECYQSNLNGQYLPANYTDLKGIIWREFMASNKTSLKFAEMKIKLLN